MEVLLALGGGSTKMVAAASPWNLNLRVLAFRTPTPAELLARHLERTLSESEEWRRPLAFGWSRDERSRAPRERMEAMLTKLAPRIATLAIADILAEENSGASR